MPRGAGELNEDGKAACRLEPARLAGFDVGKIEHAAVDLATLDGEADRGRIGIAQHLLDVEPESITQDLWDVAVSRSLTRAGKHERGTAGAARLGDRARRRVG